MKIALLSEKYTPDIGGLAISTGRLGSLLSFAGHDVRVFAPTLNLPPSETRTLPHEGIRVTRFGARKRVDDTLVDWFELIAQEHERAPFDILHAYFLPQAGFVAAYAGKYLNAPSVVSIRGNDMERAAFDPSRFSHILYALQNADAVTTNAQELARKAKGFFEREVIVIPNGIDTNKFNGSDSKPALRDVLGIDRNDFIVGFVGELREKKGLHALLNGYAQASKTNPTTLLIVGNVRAGEDKNKFDEFVSANPNAKIIVTGFVAHNDLPAYYSLMDVFVHPSLRDGMPNALLEAMSCAKAIIATPVGGILDAIKDKVNGKIIPVNDSSALANAIIELSNDKPQRERLGAAAREFVQKNFSLEKELEGNIEAYEKAKRNVKNIRAGIAYPSGTMSLRSQ